MIAAAILARQLGVDLDRAVEDRLGSPSLARPPPLGRLLLLVTFPADVTRPC